MHQVSIETDNNRDLVLEILHFYVPLLTVVQEDATKSHVRGYSLLG